MDSNVMLLAAGGVVLLGLIVVSIQLIRLNRVLGGSKKAGGQENTLEGAAIEETSHLFNDDFREELRNRGRLHFEKIIAENAMFLKQDLDVTIAQLNEHLKKEIGGKLDTEFDNYAKAMQEAQQMALGALQRSATAMDTQQQELTAAFKQELEARQAVLIQNFENNMSRIIEQYLLQALSDQIDLKTQLPLIIAQMEANKENIAKDMRL